MSKNKDHASWVRGLADYRGGEPQGQLPAPSGGGRGIVPAGGGEISPGWSWGGSSQASWSGWSWGGFSFEDTEPYTDGTRVLAHDGLDVTRARRELGTYSPIGQHVRRIKDQIPTAEGLVDDIFWSLHKRSVRPSETPLQDAYTTNAEMIGALMGNPQYQELHSEVVGDGYLAGKAVQEIAPRLLGDLTDETKARLQRQAALAEQLRQLEARRDALEELNAARGNAMLAKNLALTEKELETLRAAIEQARGQLSPGELQKLRESVNGVLGAAINTARELNAGFSALGGGLGNKDLAWAVGQTAAMGRNPLSNDMKARIAAALTKNSKVKLVAMMAGRMADIALEVQATKTPMPTDELTDIRAGREVARLLSSEYGLLGDEELEQLFDYRFATNSLREYEIIGYSPQGRGPLIVMIDNSGSMSGEPEVWSKGVMLALQLIARQQHRDFVVIHFDSTVQMVKEFPLGVADPEAALNVIEFFSGGGTNFEPPMAEALKFVSLSKYKNADCIFVTDGLCAIGDGECAEWNETRKHKGMRSYCILIGDERYGGGVMKRLTDYMTVIDPAELGQHESTDSEVLQKIFSV